MILRAYWVTSVTFDNQMVTPMADNTVRTPTPTGRSAARRVPKTMARMINESGPEIISALIRSSSMR